MSFTPEELLQQLNLKKTSTRLAVLSFLINQSQPSSADEIFQSIKDHSGLDLATVYRTLKLFISHQIIKPIDLKEGKLRYEMMSNHHHHLVCQSCGQITPVYNCCLEKTETAIARQKHFIINYHSLEFFGLCHKCQ